MEFLIGNKSAVFYFISVLKNFTLSKRKYFFITIAFFATTFGCTTLPDSDRDSTILKGHGHFAPRQIIYLYAYANPVDKFLATKTIQDSAVVDDKGNYSFSLQWNKKDFFDLKTDDIWLANNLYLRHGDKLTIDFDTKLSPIIDDDGDAALLNQFLVLFIDTFYNEAHEKNQYYIESNYYSGPQYSGYCDERQNRKLIFYKQYFSGNAPDSDFDTIMQQEIIYQSAVDKLMFAWKKRIKNEEHIIDSAYYNFLIPHFIENENALASPSYIRFINLYIGDIYDRKLANGELPQNQSEKFIPAVEKYKLALALLHKPYRDIVMYSILNDDLSQAGQEHKAINFARMPIDSLVASFCNKYGVSMTNAVSP